MKIMVSGSFQTGSQTSYRQLTFGLCKKNQTIQTMLRQFSEYRSILFIYTPHRYSSILLIHY